MQALSPSSQELGATLGVRRVSRRRWAKRAVGLLVVLSGATIMCSNFAKSATFSGEDHVVAAQHEHSGAE